MAAIRFSNIISTQALRTLNASLPTWTVAQQQDCLTRTYQFEDNTGAFDFLSLVSKMATKYQRYPELHSTNNEVTVKLAYRQVEGLNEGDLKLAKFMDKAEEHINRQEDF